MDESYTTTWVSTVCTYLLRTAERNQQSHSAFCLSSRPSVESSGLIWREYWQSVCSLIGFREQSIQMCLLCPCGSNFWKGRGRPKPSDLCLNGLRVQGIAVSQSVCSLILAKVLTCDETIRGFHQCLYEPSTLNILFLLRAATNAITLAGMAVATDHLLLWNLSSKYLKQNCGVLKA